MFTINENCLDKTITITDNSLTNKSQINNLYNYSGLKKLKEIDNILKTNIKIEKICICAYKINNTKLYPFLNFLLKNDYVNNELIFPEYNSNTLSIDIIEKTYEYLKSFLNNIILDNNFEYKGYHYYKNNIYLFFDFTNCKLQANNIYKKSIIWPALIDEIINKKNVCNIKINLAVIDFFNNNLDFTILKDKNNKIYEIPSIVYIGKEESKANFTYVFGASKPDDNELFGPYYYFTNFKNAFRQGTTNKNNKGGIIRFALFFESTKVILNNPCDCIDESNIKNELLTNSNNLYENLTLRITDYNGGWANNYDSIYLGEIDLDNGEKMRNTPIYVVKKYEQYIPLSYHFIDLNKELQIL